MTPTIEEKAVVVSQLIKKIELLKGQMKSAKTDRIVRFTCVGSDGSAEYYLDLIDMSKLREAAVRIFEEQVKELQAQLEALFASSSAKKHSRRVAVSKPFSELPLFTPFKIGGAAGQLVKLSNRGELDNAVQLRFNHVSELRNVAPNCICEYEEEV